jgi:hypothetical protein
VSSIVRPDWEFIEMVCRELYADAEELSTRITVQIRAELAGNYAMIEESDTLDHVRQEVGALLSGLIERRPPSPAEADHGRIAGRRRAEQGIHVDTLVGAYHIGYRMTWEELRQRMMAHGRRRENQLLPLMGLFWTWLRTLTSAAADGYSRAMAVREGSGAALARTLISGLSGGVPNSSAVVQAARGLGFDPDGSFQVICSSALDWPDERIARLRLGIDRRSMRAIALVHGSVLVLVAQDCRPEELLPLLAERPIAGVGLSRPGLAGAAESLTDSEQARTLAEIRSGVVFFEQDWAMVTLVAQLPRLRPLVTPGTDVSRTHLTEAVAAFIDTRFSIAGAGEALHLHPNTVRYRLARWQTVTGWDVYTLDGMLRSALSMVADKQ